MSGVDERERAGDGSNLKHHGASSLPAEIWKAQGRHEKASASWRCADLLELSVAVVGLKERVRVIGACITDLRPLAEVHVAWRKLQQTRARVV